MITPLLDELHAAMDRAAKFFASEWPPKLSLEPTASEVESHLEFLQKLWEAVDPVVKAEAEYVEAYTGHEIKDRDSVDQLRGALEGNLTYEIQCAADEIRQASWEAA